MKFIVDRVEGEFVICEDAAEGTVHKFVASDFPFIVREGDVFDFNNGAFLKLETPQDTIPKGLFG